MASENPSPLQSTELTPQIVVYRPLNVARLYFVPGAPGVLGVEALIVTFRVNRFPPTSNQSSRLSRLKSPRAVYFGTVLGVETVYNPLKFPFEPAPTSTTYVCAPASTSTKSV